MAFEKYVLRTQNTPRVNFFLVESMVSEYVELSDGTPEVLQIWIDGMRTAIEKDLSTPEEPVTLSPEEKADLNISLGYVLSGNDKSEKLQRLKEILSVFFLAQSSVFVGGIDYGDVSELKARLGWS